MHAVPHRPERVRAPLLVSILLLALVPTAQAQKAVPGEVLVVKASEAKGEIDAELRDIKALRTPPFSSFGSMKVLSKKPLKLSRTAVEVALPNGRTLRLELLEARPDGRYKVKVQINRPSKIDYLPLLEVIASPGEYFFVAGQKHDGGTLVIGVRAGEKPKPAN